MNIKNKTIKSVDFISNKINISEIFRNIEKIDLYSINKNDEYFDFLFDVIDTNNQVDITITFNTQHEPSEIGDAVYMLIQTAPSKEADFNEDQTFPLNDENYNFLELLLQKLPLSIRPNIIDGKITELNLWPNKIEKFIHEKKKTQFL